MVLELHRMGYQRLRIAPGISPSGFYWRCVVVPVTNVRREHGARQQAYDGLSAGYTSADGTAYFHWQDAGDDSPRELAEKFVVRFPELAAAGRGMDKPYADWYETMMQATAPNGVVYAYASWDLPPDRLPVSGLPTEPMIPPPPPGAA
jgi:hypothetical protein